LKQKRNLADDNLFGGLRVKKKRGVQRFRDSRDKTHYTGCLFF